MAEAAHVRSERVLMCFVHPGRTSPFKIPGGAFVRFGGGTARSGAQLSA